MDGLLKKNSCWYVRVGRFPLTLTDLIAVILFFAIGFFFFLTAPYGITEVDEALYQTIVQRLENGDKLISDEWHMVQFTSFFWYLPYKFFYTVLGGTEGIILALRYVFAALKTLFFACVYLSLRSYGITAVFAAMCFVGTDAFGIKTMNYYTVCINACFVTALILFIKKDVRPPMLVFAGFVFALGVLAEPLVAAVWILYSLLALVYHIRKKKNKPFLPSYDFVLEARVWRWLFAGVLIAFLLFAAVLCIHLRGAENVFAGVRQMLFRSEYSMPLGDFVLSRTAKICRYAKLYNPYISVLFIICVSASALVQRFRPGYAAVLFFVQTLLAVVMCVLLFVTPIRGRGFVFGEAVSHPLPLAMLGVPAYVFSGKKSRPLFAFLCFAFAVSACVDFASDCTFGVVLVLADIPAVLLIRAYFCELPKILPQTKKGCRKKRGQISARGAKSVCTAIAVALCFFPLYETAHYIYMGRLHETEYVFCNSDDALDATVSSGAYRGIRTLPAIAADYNAAAADALVIRSMCKTGLFVAARVPSVYLDADVPVATYSTFAFLLDQWTQTELWWASHPSKRPDVIYIPYKDFSYMIFPGIINQDLDCESKLAYLKTLADVTVSEGEAGYIVRVDAWR